MFGHLTRARIPLADTHASANELEGLLLGGVEQSFQFLSARLKFAQRGDKRGTHARPGALQAFPFHLKLRLEALQFSQFFDD